MIVKWLRIEMGGFGKQESAVPASVYNRQEKCVKNPYKKFLLKNMFNTDNQLVAQDNLK